MRELSLHILDVVENGINAGASMVEISVSEDRKSNLLSIEIKDNGRGIPEDLLERVTDPFYTTRKTRRVGLGLSLFREASRRCGGDFRIESTEGDGTKVFTSFRLDHIDLAPLGDLASSLTGLIAGNPMVDFIYTHRVDDSVFKLDTRELKKVLDGMAFNSPEVVGFLRRFIREGFSDIDKIPESRPYDDQKIIRAAGLPEDGESGGM